MLASPATHGPRFLGVLMLDTRFPRLPGDVGHPASFAMPVRHRVVAGATAWRVVRERDADLARPFIEAGRALVAEGARALTTSCGFLVQLQQVLQQALPVPVWTSSLLALPALGRPGVLTVDAAALGAAHFLAAGADPATPVEGLPPHGHLQRVLLEDRPTLDPAQAEAEVVACAQHLVQRRPDVRELVLECTNMPPYADAVAAATGRPVHHLLTLVHERWSLLA
ncbi:MAG: hypothetical protein RI988_584 [Pseudomonadota bacterium]